MLNLTFKNNKRLKNTSNYNIKLLKKYLSLKYFSNDSTKNFSNIFSSLKVPVANLKKFYNRNQFVPFRLLKLFSLFDFFFLKKKKVTFFLTNKFAVYNGKKSKPINIVRSNLDKILACNFRFGSFVFTRSFTLYRRRQKRKKGKKK